jgi:amidase
VPIWPNENAWQALSVEGPMARTVQDVALLLSVIAGPDLRVANSISEPGTIFNRPLDREFHGVRVAWSSTLGGLPIDPRTTAALEAQRSVFATLGCDVEEAELDWSGADLAFKTLRAWSFAQNMAETLHQHRDQLKDTVIWNIEAGLKLSGQDVARAVQLQNQLFARIHEFMQKYEFLICPVSQLPPFDINQPYITEINGQPFETYIDWMRSCYYISMTGHPAISLPCGFTPEGLPVGIQIVGRYRDEFGVLQLAHAIEQATGFWRQHPAVAR